MKTPLEEPIKKSWKPAPVFWSSLILVISQALTFYIAFQQKVFVEAYEIIAPEVSVGIPLVYFFGAVVVLGAVLFLVPVSRLRIVLRIVFALMFSWGTFIIVSFSVPAPAAPIIAVAVGLVWLFKPKVWLHNLLLAVSLASVGSVFGFLLSPWTTMSLMLVISVYDAVAVRFGYMLWMAKKLSESETIPAFIIPTRASLLNRELKEVSFPKLEDRTAEREISILGGGDIGFPLLLVVSVFFAYGFPSALIVGGFSLLGLIGAYWIQAVFLKGKPMPAMPPISLACLVGLLIVYLI